MTPRRRPEGRLVRSYVVTGGRAHPTRNTLDLVTLLVATTDLSLSGLTPETRRVMELCRPGALSLAEVAGRLLLPVSVTKVLVADLMDSGHIVTRAPIPAARPSDARILQEVLDGLRARL
ncbi:DUF742 domain-containing protein [Streptomyces europaeiscabiei]|uniref:DUF742 domain-containing protein n=1 Tax=Streptomyces TaxID=1883 RepID=UPI000A3A57B3|nr:MULTISPECIES: DUF742 domain-containing protein [Streptomyces]MDX3613335.1 DUF742 domain-containing protein [Streptomyces europaeiscabiei]MDX3628971.1 DUF742 domain-containing protein [Streptomyces europaeiscabiei]MDX3647411.1 DUF742 domain-containing protein [Streptomyces europaeiscabiei]WUD36221.1 DUF742 domain-containing protein [Streptomyces europaeiscabiei]